MSKRVQNPSHATKQSVPATKININNETIINSITGYETNLGEQLEHLEHEAELQAQQLELSECLEFVAQLIDLFKHTVITSELQNQNDWHNDTRYQLQQHKGVTGNRIFDEKIEKIVISKGLTKEQWRCLLYMGINTADRVEITNVSKKYLKKVHDKAARLLEEDEQSAVFALINAIEKYMSKDYFTDK
jgi:CBS-domain-containing membrane protein